MRLMSRRITSWTSKGSAVQIASASVSLVRIRTTWSRPYTKILPSPIFPVFADEVIVLMILAT
jgi:hypothetical protein